MAKKVVWTLAAWNDLETIADFISQDSPYYAAAWVRNVRDAARSLGVSNRREWINDMLLIVVRNRERKSEAVINERRPKGREGRTA